jgi:excisionase family DNA binding protein
MMDQQGPKLLSPNRAAAKLDISRSTLYQLMKLGRVRYVMVGADRRIPVEEIDRIASEGASTKAA